MGNTAAGMAASITITRLSSTEEGRNLATICPRKHSSSSLGLMEGEAA